MTGTKRSSKLLPHEQSPFELLARSAFMEDDVLIGHMARLVDAVEGGKPIPEDTLTFFARVFEDFLGRNNSVLLDASTDVRRAALADALMLRLVGRGAPVVDVEDTVPFRRAIQVEEIVLLAATRDGGNVRVSQAVELVADHWSVSMDTVQADRKQHAGDVKRAFSAYKCAYDDVIFPAQQCGEIASQLIALVRDQAAIEPFTISVPVCKSPAKNATITFPFELKLLQSIRLRGNGFWRLALVVGCCARESDRMQVYHYLSENLKEAELREIGQRLLAGVKHKT